MCLVMRSKVSCQSIIIEGGDNARPLEDVDCCLQKSDCLLISYFYEARLNIKSQLLKLVKPMMQSVVERTSINRRDVFSSANDAAARDALRRTL